MSKRFKKLSHTIYERKYHIVICPKYRFRIFEDEIAEYTRQQTYILCRQKELVEILEFNIQKDHIHMVMWIPPKYSISTVMGFLKGKLSLRLFQTYEQLDKRYWGRHLWARGDCLSTIGLNEQQIREYVKWQEKREKEIEKRTRTFEAAMKEIGSLLTIPSLTLQTIPFTGLPFLRITDKGLADIKNKRLVSLYVK